MPYCRIRCTITEMRADCLYIWPEKGVETITLWTPPPLTLKTTVANCPSVYRYQFCGPTIEVLFVAAVSERPRVPDQSQPDDPEVEVVGQPPHERLLIGLDGPHLDPLQLQQVLENTLFRLEPEVK